MAVAFSGVRDGADRPIAAVDAVVVSRPGGPGSQVGGEPVTTYLRPVIGRPRARRDPSESTLITAESSWPMVGYSRTTATIRLAELAETNFLECSIQIR
ncbi:hypothetical protein [Nocardia goodfellowii]|uniref:Uncharacterized protein n=1 Tax=Nocardia goodfellowii TaxID=882446 RepID=A0ABS4QLB5_9NOCA|nr:hypothetical protein [Nocardia goodfellowii]MBP2192498.1 hypothetical protein [Nocardia goodfellowii]